MRLWLSYWSSAWPPNHHRRHRRRARQGAGPQGGRRKLEDVGLAMNCPILSRLPFLTGDREVWPSIVSIWTPTHRSSGTSPLLLTMGESHSSFAAAWIPARPTLTSLAVPVLDLPAVCGFQFRHADLLHLEHRFHHAPCLFAVRVSQQVPERGGDHLPRKPEAIF